MKLVKKNTDFDAQNRRLRDIRQCPTDSVDNAINTDNQRDALSKTVFTTSI